ncbi:Cytochrom_B561 domain-containing protein [Cephalotus follicularis]|uniref:Cytochrom_B561 domain-containing protein n=1 Tax=Cephalotus follicularis TaxID=3775 RepID=A0A1Q3BEM3_CEPFO|nr:Cytochrom_B561 domain-containing protein [Cephalotus follicularis]
MHNKMSPQMTSNIILHGCLLWGSMGFLMPMGILTIRMSSRMETGRMIKVLFYVHAILQTLSVLLATAGAIMSIKHFENSFDNNHQRIGLALYFAIWVQAVIGFLRPHRRGNIRRITWYLVHWVLGTMISLLGIINIFTGLQAYHKKTSKSTSIWTILFTAQVSFMGFFYLFQDKWDYMQKQGVILGNNGSITPSNQEITQRDKQKGLLPEPCAKPNALKNLVGMGEEERKKREVVVESLGWLTESSIMPKKHRAIEGVGPSSILELKAELYKSQEDSKKSNGPDLDFHRAKKKITPHTPFSLKNSGVDARARKDKLELKAINDGSAVYAALERKAALYDKLARGELSDEEDKEKYCVDFFRKGVDQEESQRPQGNDNADTLPLEEENGETDASVLFNMKFVGPGRTVGTTKDNNEHKRFVREVHEEANQAREMVSELKLRRQEQAAARREKLRQAYLRKQLEKLIAVPKIENT